MLGNEAYVSPQILGGGYGGDGIGGSGVLTGLLFGTLLDRNRNEGDGHTAKDMIAFDLTNKNIDNVEKAVHQASLKDAIRDVTDNIHEQSQHNATRHEAFALGVTRDFGDIKAGLKDIVFQGALNTKDIIGSQKDCCCEIKEVVSEQGRLTRDLIQALDKENLRDKLSDKTLELSQCKQTAELADLKYGMKDIASNNVNFGTQISQITQALNSLVSKG